MPRHELGWRPEPSPAMRWTNGDGRGEKLRGRVWGAHRPSGPAATYAVRVNTVPLAIAQDKVGPLRSKVAWHRFVPGDSPIMSTDRLDGTAGEGIGWRLAPLRLYPDRHDLSTGDECARREVLPAMAVRRATPDRLLFAADAWMRGHWHRHRATLYQRTGSSEVAT